MMSFCIYFSTVLSALRHTVVPQSHHFLHRKKKENLDMGVSHLVFAFLYHLCSISRKEVNHYPGPINWTLEMTEAAQDYERVTG